MLVRHRTLYETISSFFSAIQNIGDAVAIFKQNIELLSVAKKKTLNNEIHLVGVREREEEREKEHKRTHILALRLLLNNHPNG